MTSSLFIIDTFTRASSHGQIQPNCC